MRARRALTGFVTIALVASMAACGNDESADTTETEGAADTAAPVDATEPAEAPPVDSGDDVDRDAVLRYGYYIELSRFDPHLANGSNDLVWLTPAYDRLAHLTPEGAVIPGLAESWEFLDDGQVLRLNLRPEVLFHDGENFDAEAVKANIERAQTVEGSAVSSVLEPIESVDVVDDLTVDLNLATPDAALPATLSTRAGMMISPAAFDNDDLDTFPVGAGAYRVVDHVVGDRVVYERFEDYWDIENSHLAGIEMVLLVDVQTRLNALTAGQIDAAELETIQISDIERAGLDYKVEPDVSFGIVQVNSELRPEFSDPRVMRAINHAIDREAITEGVFFGYARPAVQPTPEGYFAHNPDYGPDYYEFNPDLARELLAEAGYEDGFAFELQTTTGPSRIAVSEAVQAMLGDVGLDVSVNPIAGAGPFLDNVYGSRTADAWMLAWGGRPDPSITIGSLYGPDSFYNPGNRLSDEVVDLYERSLTTFDPEERAAVLQELSGAIVESDSDVVILYSPDKVLAWNDRVENIDLWATGRAEMRGVRMTSG